MTTVRRTGERRRRIPCLAAFVLLAAAVQGAAASGSKLDSVIDSAVAAHGGARLTAVSSLVMEWALEDALVFQSVRPGPPWDRTRRWAGFAIDFDERRYADARYDGASGYEWVTGTVAGPKGSFRLDYRSRSFRPLDVGFDEAIGDALLLSPLVMLRWLDERREIARYRGRRHVAGRDLEVLEVARGTDAGISIFLDADSGRIHRVESGYTAYDGARVPLHYRYLDWSEFDGLHQPARVEVRAHGYASRRASLTRLSVNEPLDAHYRVPDEFQRLAVEAERLREFRLDEIADGVYFVGEGVMYQLIVEFDDFLVALDSSSGDVRRRIDAIRQRIPNKSFRYVLASHHHSDHLHGLDDYVSLGATILAAPSHADAVGEYVEAELGRKPEVLLVDDEFTVADSARELRVMHIGPTPHSERMLTAYLPAERILFAADLYVLGGRRKPARPAMPNGLLLFEHISARKLDVARIVDPHSPLIATMTDLRRSVDRLRHAVVDPLQRAREELAAWHTAGDHVRRSP